MSSLVRAMLRDARSLYKSSVSSRSLDTRLSSGFRGIPAYLSEVSGRITSASVE